MSSSLKKRTNVTIDGDLLDEARKLGLNVSTIAETALDNVLREARAKMWREENADAIADYNRWIDENGVPLSQFRKF